ncbi:MAG TPA: aminotransferase class I/II-fold pyridoxal phosphate-dependent enzyme [Actinomycetota bacterium]
MAKRRTTNPPMGFTTRAVHAAEGVDPMRQRPLSAPIYQAATFAFDDIDDFAAVAQSKLTGGYLYSRWANPTTDALARAVASLEGAEAAACFASGMAAIHAALVSRARSGDHVVASKHLYGGSFGLLGRILPRAGIDATFVEIADHAEVAAAFRDNTTVVFFETIANPTMIVADIDALSSLARAHGAATLVDATFTPSYLLLALDHGADLVIHSATKYLGGHSDVTAGVVAGAGKAIRAIRTDAIDYGATLAPLEAWLTLRGIQTLSLRMERICANALALAHFLASRSGIKAVHYPGLPAHPQHALAKQLMPRGFGGMLAFEVSGGRAAGRTFLERVRVASPAASLGGTKTLVVHPASVTHTQLSVSQRRAAGITDGLIRVSVGIEDPEDLIADFDRALG